MPTVVLQTAFLGDVVLTTPLLDALAHRHGPVDVVTTPAAAALLETHPAVRAVIRHDKHGADRGPGGIRRLALALRAGNYARAYLPHQSWRSGLATLASGIPERVGFAEAPARWCYTRRAPRPADGHETGRLLALVGVTEERMPTLGLTDEDRAIAGAWLDRGGVPAHFIAVAPGSIWGTKRWDKFPALLAGSDWPVVIVGGPDDRALGEALVAVAADRTWSACGALPLRASAALLERAAALVTNDSLPLHLAQATGTPTVALFGPTITGFGFGPRGRRDVVLEVMGLDCRPCSRHGPARCPRGHHRCMTDLDVASVATALDEILATA